MNLYESEILKFLYKEQYINQRVISEKTGYSLGAINKSVKSLVDSGFLSEDLKITRKADAFVKMSSPKKAIILAAGYGMRMVPINLETPKPLLDVNGERIIERQIKYLHDSGITEIYVIVGFMKEEFEYLIDQFDVKLIVNPDYATRNNLHSLCLASKKIENAYIVPGDVWFEVNPFSTIELYSWYSVSDYVDDDSEVRINRKNELVRVSKNQGGNSMVGLAYLCGSAANLVASKIQEFDLQDTYNDSFWEETLYDGDRMIVQAKVLNSMNAIEINTYEQLRELDKNSIHLKNLAIDIIKETFHVHNKEIEEIKVLKKGMTNRSFLFEVDGKRYIMRIPGEGTDQLINRREEAEVYNTIKDKGICDDIVYINPENGYKITAYLEGARNCDPTNVSDLNACMKRLREFHSMKLEVPHTFDIFKQIDFYEELMKHQSIYRDYSITKERVQSLKAYIDTNKKDFVLTHIDAVPDNFLFVNSDDGVSEIKLIDWEYAGMQDPDVDIAMFCIYSLYEKDEVDRLIDIYYSNNCNKSTRLKIYCYIAACGLLWSNWCEYKRSLGVEFGEYALRQYRYAKDYFKYFKEASKE